MNVLPSTILHPVTWDHSLPITRLAKHSVLDVVDTKEMGDGAETLYCGLGIDSLNIRN